LDVYQIQQNVMNIEVLEINVLNSMDMYLQLLLKSVQVTLQILINQNVDQEYVQII